MHYKPSMNPTVSVTADRVQESMVVRVSGDVDRAAVPHLQRHLAAVRHERSPALLDLSGVTFVDSAGLRFLIEICRGGSDGSPPFWIVRPSSPVRRLLEITGAHDVLPVLDGDP